MYYIDRTVAFSETGPDGCIKLTNLIDLYQDIAIFQSEECGVGMDELTARGRGWVVNSWQIVVDRYPALGEKIRIGTAPYEFKGVMGKRNFVIETMSGERISYANSIWAYVDTEKMAPARIDADVAAAYVLEPKLDMDYESRKITVPGELAAATPIEVKYHHLDSNDHVNNAQYVTMAEDTVKEGRRARQIRVEYRASAKSGDIVFPYINEDPANDKYTVVLADKDTEPYAIVEFRI